MPSGFAQTPPPPYYAVIFTSRLGPDDQGYDTTAAAMARLAENQAGYLGIESARGGDRVGITVSYWTDEASILAWKGELKHLFAQKTGIEKWYEHYELRVAKVERAYAGPEGRSLG